MTTGARARTIEATRRCLLALSLAGLPALAVAAEGSESMLDLKGVTNATLGVSQLTADGVQCGLDLTQIGHAAHQPVADAGLAVREVSDNRITISAVTSRVGSDQCATTVMLGAYARETFFSSVVGWVQSGYVVVWQRALMVATPIGQHAAAVNSAARRLSEQMLADWRTQNRPLPAAAAPAGGRRVAAETGTAATKASP